MKKLEDVMTRQVDYCEPDNNLYEAAVKMKKDGVGAIPVCKDDKVVGMVTDRDIVLRAVAEKKPNSTQVSEIMTEDILTASPDTSVDEAAKLMAEEQVRRLPVVKDGKLEGMCSLGDLAVHTSTEDEAGYALSEISEEPKYHH
ncbi:CBS domain-containing protein [Evansella clarkii]|jgi:CBS domain-containing protein|uniref:CBS domain-containing protein n=1 Tax=Evansella clarkii TaxID=79879 RepID=UPI0009961027|nr:CBS domain-containing protein [Evansella clarkii]